MNILVTVHVPIKAKFSEKDLSCTIYIPFKKWIFGYGGWGKSKWFRILGLTFMIGYWQIWPLEFNFEIK